MRLLLCSVRLHVPRLPRDRNKMALLGALLMVVPVFLMLTGVPVVLRNIDEVKFMKDSKMALSWEGFGPEKGMYNFTLVTAMLDIGRGNWSSHQKRSYNTYLLYMQRVLRLDVNMVIFIDSKGRPFVDWMRRGREKRTKVVEMTLEELPYYRYRIRMKEIMESAEYRENNELVRKGLCEANIPEYDILQWSKLFFLDQAISTNPFSDQYFIWMDGGYGRGEDIHPSDGVWTPTRLFHNPDQVTFLEREPVDNYRQHSAYLHKMSINIVAGGFIAGGGGALERLYKLQQELLEEWMVHGVVDDDQTVYMQLYFKNPELFHFVRADWYDAFKLFDPRRRLL